MNQWIFAQFVEFTNLNILQNISLKWCYLLKGALWIFQQLLDCRMWVHYEFSIVTAHKGSVQEANVFSLSVCSQGDMPPTTNDTWWIDLELQETCPLLLMTTSGWIRNYRGMHPLLLTPGGWIWNYRELHPLLLMTLSWWIWNYRGATHPSY